MSPAGTLNRIAQPEPESTPMYPHTTQFETRRLELDRDAPVPRPAANRRPPRVKLALLTWAGAYVAITAVLEFLGPTMESWPLEVRTLVLSAVMVAALTWLLMPALTRLFRPWLERTT